MPKCVHDHEKQLQRSLQWNHKTKHKGLPAFSPIKNLPQKATLKIIKCTHTHTHAGTHARTHTHTHIRTHARMHARTHARTHARMHARTHTHRHTWFRYWYHIIIPFCTISQTVGKKWMTVTILKQDRIQYQFLFTSAAHCNRNVEIRKPLKRPCETG